MVSSPTADETLRNFQGQRALRRPKPIKREHDNEKKSLNRSGLLLFIPIRRRIRLDELVLIILVAVVLVLIVVVATADGHAVALHLVLDVLGRDVAAGGVAELGRELGPLDALVLGLHDGEDAAVAAAPEAVRGEAAGGRVQLAEDVEPGVVGPVFVAAGFGVFFFFGLGAAGGCRRG
ncbi:uncharacterized protein PG986_000296 [Apiospora aurea]|uniref:Uncharacterized protein n=1 Tax=Apiospora aurea TaxID=335848 RepID=A0ABR1QTK8_9PEZI